MKTIHIKKEVARILITREIDYAIRIARILYRKGQQSAVEISQNEGIPMSFAYKILKKLELGGIVEILRGSTGGYRLKKDCREMTLFDIVSALNEDIFITECMVPDHQCTSRQSEHCGIHKEFGRIQNVLNQEMKKKPLHRLL